MECRDVRPLIGKEQTLAADERQQVEAHFHSCEACRDELDDPVGIALAGARLPLAIPPPDFTQQLMLRLPDAAPIVLAQQQMRSRRAFQTAAWVSLAVVSGFALLGLALIRYTAVRAADIFPAIGLPFALASKAILAALGQPAVVVSILVAAVLVWAFLRRAQLARVLPPLLARPALPAAALALLLFVNAAAGRDDLSAVRSSITVSGPVAGNVTSVASDITIDGEVRGDVVSLMGRVALQPGARVQGSVMAGAGVIKEAGAQVGQSEVPALGPLPALMRAAGSSPAPLAGASATRLLGLGAALLTLLLAGLMVVAWPQGPIEASVYVARFPGRAMLIGLLGTLGLWTLGLAGATLLAATVGGVLLVPVLLLGLHLPYVAGVATIGQMLGTRFAGARSIGGALWGVAVQLIVVVALALLAPLAGLISFYVLGSVGLGGVLLAPRRAASGGL
jgi:hypothetical protein